MNVNNFNHFPSPVQWTASALDCMSRSIIVETVEKTMLMGDKFTTEIVAIREIKSRNQTANPRTAALMSCLPSDLQDSGAHRSMELSFPRLGGFLGRKSDGHPGVKTIWLGMKEVYVAAKTMGKLRDRAAAKTCV